MRPDLFVTSLLLSAMPAAAADGARLVLLRVQYVGTDYAKAIAEDGGLLSAFEWEEQRTYLREAAEAYRALAPDGGLGTDFAALQAAVDAKTAPSVVGHGAQLLAIRVGRELSVGRYPLLWPSLEGAERNWQRHCASCHGDAGAGDGPAALALDPKPPDLRSPAWSTHRSPLQLYDAITLGLPGTAMPSFDAELGGAAGWSLAFWLLTLTPPRGAPPDGGPWVGLSELAERSTAELAERARLDRGWTEEEGLRWADALRRAPPPPLTVPAAMECLASAARRAQALVAEGRRAEARDVHAAGYYDCVEPVEEQLLPTHAPELLRLEQHVQALAAAIAGTPAQRRASVATEAQAVVLAAAHFAEALAPPVEPAPVVAPAPSPPPPAAPPAPAPEAPDEDTPTGVALLAALVAAGVVAVFARRR